jgi:DNA polymerase III epsilon subunit-like protein
MTITYLCFDTETTGLPADPSRSGLCTPAWENCRMIELGCVLFEIVDGKAKIIDTYCSFTDYLMNDEQLKITEPIHHISNEMISKEGNSMKIVLEEFKRFYNRADYVIAHNMKFDINVMLNEYHLLNESFIHVLVFSPKLLCTSRQLHSIKNNKIKSIDRTPRISLINLFKEYFPDKMFVQHRAIQDARATVDCFVHQLSLCDVCPT